MTAPYEFERFEGQPLFLERFHAAFSVADHLTQSAAELAQHLDSYDQQVYFVLDAIDIKVNFGDMVSALGQTAGGKLGVLRHPNIKELIIVVNSSMLRMGANALGQAQYGGLKTTAFSDLEEAMAYARQQIEG